MIWLLLALGLVAVLAASLGYVAWRFDRFFPPEPTEIELARQELIRAFRRFVAEIQPPYSTVNRIEAAFGECGRSMAKVAPLLRQAEEDRRRMYRAARRRR